MDVKAQAEKLSKIRAEFINFDNYVKNLYSNQQDNLNGSKAYKGYIIDLKNFDELKNKINSNDITGIKPLEQIHFITSSYLISMILNNNKYIIISELLYKTTCHKEKVNENPIDYIINSKELILQLPPNLKFSVDDKNNIIGKYCYIFDNNPNFSLNFDVVSKFEVFNYW